MSRFIDITGQKFGRLTAIEKTNKKNSKGYLWYCKCDCGNICYTNSYRLRSGHTKSCGCITKKHGFFGTRIYKIWDSMKQRCYNPKCDAYMNYGGRGITICDEWKNDFMSFCNWSMNNGYSDNLTIDRIDVNGNYEPSNCRWADDIIQHNNTRKNPHFEYKGEIHTIPEWSRITGLNINTIKERIFKYHWSIEDSLTTPPDKQNRKRPK